MCALKKRTKPLKNRRSNLCAAEIFLSECLDTSHLLATREETIESKAKDGPSSNLKAELLDPHSMSFAERRSRVSPRRLGSCELWPWRLSEEVPVEFFWQLFRRWCRHVTTIFFQRRVQVARASLYIK